MGLLSFGNEHQQRLLSLDFVRILIFALKKDTWLSNGSPQIIVSYNSSGSIKT